MLNIEKTTNGNELTVKLTGRLDTTSAPELESWLGENSDGANNIVFDFSDLAYISSSGLRVVLSEHKKMNALGGSIKIVHANELIMEILESVGFLDFLTVEND